MIVGLRLARIFANLPSLFLELKLNDKQMKNTSDKNTLNLFFKKVQEEL